VYLLPSEALRRRRARSPSRSGLALAFPRAVAAAGAHCAVKAEVMAVTQNASNATVAVPREEIKTAAREDPRRPETRYPLPGAAVLLDMIFDLRAGSAQARAHQLERQGSVGGHRRTTPRTKMLKSDLRI
jgi:hypothetical protein